LISVLLLLNAYFVWSTGTRLEKRLAELRAAGEPVQLADLANEPISPEKNADAFLRRANDDLDAIQKELAVLYPKRGFSSDPLTPVEREKLEKLFAAFPRLMPTLEQAANCAESDPQLDFTLPASKFLEPFMDHIGKHRVISRVLQTRSALLIAQGRSGEAIATQILMLRLARGWRREPLIMGFLVTAVCEQTAIDSINRILQAAAIPEHFRKSLDRELALHDTKEGYIWALQSERCYALASTWEMPGMDIWLTRGFVNDLCLKLIELFDRHLQLARQPAGGASSQRGKPPVATRGANPLGAIAQMLEPALNAARDPAERKPALARTLRVLNALQEHAASGGDHDPKLSELGLPAEATIDPFNGEPLRVKKLPDGWMVYSVGANLIDDGGKLEGRADVGVGPTASGVPKKGG
jgi:hypothetical protein